MNENQIAAATDSATAPTVVAVTATAAAADTAVVAAAVAVTLDIATGDDGDVGIVRKPRKKKVPMDVLVHPIEDAELD